MASHIFPFAAFAPPAHMIASISSADGRTFTISISGSVFFFKPCIIYSYKLCEMHLAALGGKGTGERRTLLRRWEGEEYITTGFNPRRR